MNPNKEEGHLFIISVPIGNLKDITERAKETLQTVDMIACEDTRVTGKLLKAPSYTKRNSLISYRDENEHALL